MRIPVGGKGRCQKSAYGPVLTIAIHAMGSLIGRTAKLLATLPIMEIQAEKDSERKPAQDTTLPFEVLCMYRRLPICLYTGVPRSTSDECNVRYGKAHAAEDMTLLLLLTALEPHWTLAYDRG